MTKDSWKSLIASLPEGLSYSEASKRLDRDYQSVRQAIIRYHYKAIDGRKLSQNGRRKFDPDKADWAKSNQWNATEQDCSRELVRRYRNRLSKPFVESRGRKRAKCNCDPNQHQCCDVCTGWNKTPNHKDKK